MVCSEISLFIDFLYFYMLFLVVNFHSFEARLLQYYYQEGPHSLKMRSTDSFVGTARCSRLGEGSSQVQT